MDTESERRTEFLRVLMITTGSGDLERTIASAAGARRGGVRAVQIREPAASARELLHWIEALREIWPAHEGILLVNDRVDLAVHPSVDGVHLGWRSLGTQAARAILGPRRWIGRSIHHTNEESDEVANYFLYGPVFDTPKKRGLLEPRGPARLKEMAERANQPVIAVGGIDADSVGGLRSCGAFGVAAIRAFADPATAEDQARSLVAWARNEPK